MECRVNVRKARGRVSKPNMVKCSVTEAEAEAARARNGRAETAGREWGLELTWDNVSSVHRIFVLDEAKAVHELDLGNLAGAMGVEVVLNIGLGSCHRSGQRCQDRKVTAKVR